MKIFILSIFTFLSFAVINSHAATKGSCEHYWQTAADGSICGRRAADQHQGGKP